MKSTIALVSVIFLIVASTHAELRLPAVISDHAMLQAAKPVPLWGLATPGAQVKVTFVGQASDPVETFTASADANGKWSGELPAMKAGTAGQLQISSDKDGSTTLHDILVGEVWLAGGQSNMEYPINGKPSFADPSDPEEIAEVNQNIVIAQKEADSLTPPIRFFVVISKGSDEPADDVKGNWVLADSKKVPTFSAVAWNFAVALQNKLHLPIGMVVSCMGGTPIECWMSKETLAATSVGAAVLDRLNQELAAVTSDALAKYDSDLKVWEAANPTPALQFKHTSTRPRPPFTKTNYRVPIRLYNGMIHGLEPYALRGIIWFQADGNIKHPLEYSELFLAMIKEWRADWKETLPFYFVEMNNMREAKQTNPVQPHDLCLLREQQHSALQLPGVGMVASIDLAGKNIHFPNKKPVGERLANLALRDSYHLPMGQVESPLYKGFAIEGNKVRVKFSNADGLRVRGGGDLKGFAIRGNTGDWVWATGQIEGEEIVVGSDQVAAPVAVRYAWAANPIISVENSAGLPLFPFRTDSESPN